MKKLALLFCFSSFAFILSACAPNTQGYNVEWNTVENSEALPAPSVVDWKKQYINDNVYTYYYGQTCSHCKKVEDYLKKTALDQRIHIVPKEVQMNKDNQQELLDQATALNVPISQVWTPFVVVEYVDGKKSSLVGEDEVLTHFKELEQQVRSL